MLVIKKSEFLSITLLFICNAIFSQNNTSPYSIIGIGDIEKSNFDRTSGLGYAGASLFSNRYLYNINPASYSALDDKFFNFEFSARFKSTSYTGNSVSSMASSVPSTDLQIKKMIIALKLKPFWGFSAGILPYSSANYLFVGNKTIQGSNIVLPTLFDGSGGVNQFYIANSFKLHKGLRVGLQYGYLFGQLLQEETISSGLTNGDLVTSKNIAVGKGYFKAGIQYNTALSKKWQLLLGGTADVKTNIKATTTTTVKDGTNEVAETETFDANYFTIPSTYKTSIAFKLKDKYTFVADYSFQNWSNIKYRGLGYTLVNSNTFSIGTEYAKKLHFRDGSFERFFLQSGIFFSNSYLRIRNEQIKDYGFTIGGGINSLRNNLGVQMNLEFGKRGTTNKGLILENYSQLNLTFTYRDFWFVKVKRYD